MSGTHCVRLLIHNSNQHKPRAQRLEFRFDRFHALFKPTFLFGKCSGVVFASVHIGASSLYCISDGNMRHHMPAIAHMHKHQTNFSFFNVSVL